jgi:hypothetical protein
MKHSSMILLSYKIRTICSLSSVKYLFCLRNIGLIRVLYKKYERYIPENAEFDTETKIINKN